MAQAINFTEKELQIMDIMRDAAEQLGTNIYLVGGCVRDKILNRPNKDLDFVVDGDAKNLIAYLTKKYNLDEPILLERSQAWMLRIGDFDIDIIGAEKLFTPLNRAYEEETLEGEEEFSTSLDDAFRRDLTINSLMYDVKNNKILDPTGKGMQDLQQRKIDTIINPFIKYKIHAPDMLRALRFAVTLDFELEDDVLQAMRENAHRIIPRDQGGDISNRRIRRELRKGATSVQTWEKLKRLLAETGLADYLADDMLDVEQDLKGGIDYPELEQIEVGKQAYSVKGYKMANLEKEIPQTIYLFWQSIVQQLKNEGYDEDQIRNHFTSSSPQIQQIVETILLNTKTAQWLPQNTLTEGPPGSNKQKDTPRVDTLKKKLEEKKKKEIEKKREQLAKELSEIADLCDKRQLHTIANRIDNYIKKN